MEETTEVTTEAVETKTEQTEAVEAAPAEETVPKHRLDEVIAERNTIREEYEKALAYIRGYTANTPGEREQPAVLTEAQRLERLETAFVDFANKFESQRVYEKQADQVITQVKAELGKRPHLERVVNEIWKDVSFYGTEKSVKEIADYWDKFLTDVRKDGVEAAVKSKREVAGHVTAGAIRGTPKLSPSAVDKFKNKSWEDFWDSAEDYVKSGVRSRQEE